MRSRFSPPARQGGFALVGAMIAVAVFSTIMVMFTQMRMEDATDKAADRAGVKLARFEEAVAQRLFHLMAYDPTLLPVSGTPKTYTGVDWLKHPIDCGTTGSEGVEEAFLPCDFTTTLAFGVNIMETQVTNHGSHYRAVTRLGPPAQLRDKQRLDLAGRMLRKAEGSFISSVSSVVSYVPCVSGDLVDAGDCTLGGIGEIEARLKTDFDSHWVRRSGDTMGGDLTMGSGSSIIGTTGSKVRDFDEVSTTTGEKLSSMPNFYTVAPGDLVPKPCPDGPNTKPEIHLGLTNVGRGAISTGIIGVRVSAQDLPTDWLVGMEVKTETQAWSPAYTADAHRRVILAITRCIRT